MQSNSSTSQLIDSQTETTIREASTPDLAQIADLWRDWAISEGHPNPDVEKWLEQSRILLTSSALICVVAIENGNVVGFIDAVLSYEPVDRSTVLLGRYTFIRPEHRGKALSLALMSRLLTAARQAGATGVVVHNTLGRHAAKILFGRDAVLHRSQYIVRW